MLDHIAINVVNYERSKQFYLAALAPLGYTLMMEGTSGAGFRTGSIPDFWHTRRYTHAADTHCVCLPKSGAVTTFYQAALAAGGRDNGASGLRPHYLRTTTARLCSIRMVTTSKRFATDRNRGSQTIFPSLQRVAYNTSRKKR